MEPGATWGVVTGFAKCQIFQTLEVHKVGVIQEPNTAGLPQGRRRTQAIMTTETSHRAQSSVCPQTGDLYSRVSSVQTSVGEGSQPTQMLTLSYRGLEK